MKKQAGPTTTSGVIIKHMETRRRYMKSATTLEECCFHYAIGRSLHEAAVMLHSIKRLRETGLERVNQAYTRLSSTWQDITSTVLHTHPIDSDGEELEEWSAFLSEVDSYCDSRYHGDFTPPAPSGDTSTEDWVPSDRHCFEESP